MAKKLFAACLVLFTFAACSFVVSAQEPCSRDYFLEKVITFSEKLNIPDKNIAIPEEYKNGSKTSIKAAEKGIIAPENINEASSVVLKQDAVRIIYNILKEYDKGFEISDTQAEKILNSCYDNGYLKEENKTAYASFIKHGVIGVRGLTYPNRLLTDETCELLISRVQSLFRKKLPLTVGGKTISIGSLTDEVYSVFGEPSRIEKSEFGFQWFVYNSHYTEFVLIGIRDDVVCAYFTNSADFQAETGARGMTVFKDANGKVQGVYYNESPVTENIEGAVQSRLLNDIVNAHRAKHSLMTFTTPEVDAKPVTAHEGVSVEFEAEDCFSGYSKLLKSDDRILSVDFGVGSLIRPVLKENLWTVTVIDSGKIVTSFPRLRSAKKESTQPVGYVKKPKVKEITPTAKGISIVLEERPGNRVLVKLYNREKEEYDVFAYLDITSETIVIPEYMLTKGNIYDITVTAGENESNKVQYTHGEAVTPLMVISPVQNLSTYDDELEIEVYSSAFRDFRIDVYDKKDKTVLTRALTGESKVTLESLPQGTYHLCITAVSHATGEDMANKFITVQIKNPVPQIKEFILEPGERFDYYYGDGKEFLYFYDTETIAVTEDRTVTVPVQDMMGETDPLTSGEAPVRYEEIKESVTVYKTKITQRKVPVTKKYKRLAELIPERIFTTGAFMERKTENSSDTGNAIAAMALSYQGVPYLWGGTSPSGFDCSGLVKYICNSLGIKNVARNSAQQFATSGTFVEKEDLIPGDLVFFQKNGAIHHVGIYIGNNCFVHAPSTGDVVKVSSLSESYYKREYAGAKRVTGE